MVEQVNALGPLAQYGAIGIIAGLLFISMLGMFKVFINTTLKTNADLQKQNFDMQMQTLTALNNIERGIVSMKTDVVGAVSALKTELSTDVRELDHTVSNMFNELSNLTGGSRGYALGNKPLKRG